MDEPTNEPENEPIEERRRLNRFQQFAVILVGVMMILVGLATIFAGRLFNPYIPAGALFAPFALAGGALVIVLALRAGRR